LGIEFKCKLREKIENEIRRLLGIPEDETLINIYENEVKKKIYYILRTYDPKTKKIKRYRIRRTLEKEILFLWKQYQKEKEQAKELEQEVKALLEKYRDAEKIREVLEKLAEDSLIKTASSYAIKTYTTKAKELFKEFIRRTPQTLQGRSFKKTYYFAGFVSFGKSKGYLSVSR